MLELPVAIGGLGVVVSLATVLVKAVLRQDAGTWRLVKALEARIDEMERRIDECERERDEWQARAYHAGWRPKWRES